MVAQAAADEISRLLNVESGLASQMSEALYGDNAQPMKAVATGTNPNFHPEDDQLVREFVHGVEESTDHLFMTIPRSALDAVVRRLLQNSF